MPLFDPKLLMTQTFESALDTEIPQWPEGEYLSRIDKVEIKPWSSDKLDENGNKKSGMRVNFFWVTDDPAVRDAGANALIQSVMLDLTAAGALDMGKGKNVRLGRILAAVGCNDVGWSFPGLVGRSARIRVKHELYENRPQAKIDDYAEV